MAKQDGKNFAHPPNLPFGENIHWYREKNTSVFTCHSVVENWYNEKLNYDWIHNGVNNRAGHFTQVVWNSTHKIGCAAVAGTGPHGGIFTVCNYHPWGNVANQFDANVISLAKCNQIREYDYRDVTKAKWEKECLDEHNRIRLIHGVPLLLLKKEVN